MEPSSIEMLLNRLIADLARDWGRALDQARALSAQESQATPQFAGALAELHEYVAAIGEHTDELSGLVRRLMPSVSSA